MVFDKNADLNQGSCFSAFLFDHSKSSRSDRFFQESETLRLFIEMLNEAIAS